MNRMMIDIESLSLHPNAAVIQVGVCVFNFLEKKYIVEPTNYDIDVDSQKGRVIDFDTLCWWMRQDRKVTDSVFTTSASVGRLSPIGLYHTLDYLVNKLPVDEVWAAPAMYDLAVLVSLWEGKRPWDYQKEMDMSTLYRMFERAGTPVPEPAKSNDMQHNAAADAFWQMEYLRSILDVMKVV